MKKKVLSILVIFVILISALKINVNAESGCQITLIPQSSVEPGKEIKIELKLSNITTNDGIGAYQTTLTYNSDIFSYSSVDGNGTWEKPTVNTDTKGIIKLVATTSDGECVKKDDTMAILTFKVNSNTAEGKYEIGLNNTEVSDGNQTLNVQEYKTNIIVKKASENNTDKTDDNKNSTTNNTTDQNNTNNSNNATDKNNTNNSNNATDKNNTNTSNNATDKSNTNTSNNVSDKNNTNKSNTTTNKNNNVTTTNTTNIKTKDNNTKVLNNYPYSGVEKIVIPIISVAVVVIVLSYFKYRRYKNI